LIKFRIDVDYPYPSRLKSFIYTASNLQLSKDYLKNSKIIARMINDSSVEMKAYWFFTTRTLPDTKLLSLLNSQKHEIALHLTNYPFKEKKILEKTIGKTIKYFTIHGTARLITRILWRRWKTTTPNIPKTFPLKSFHQFPTLSLDVLCYSYDKATVFTKAKENIKAGKIIEIHPDWLFQKGFFNHRGPYYSSLREILKVDKEINNLEKNQKIFTKIGRNTKEYEKNIIPDNQLLTKLKELNFDIFTFIERSWCYTLANTPKNWIKTEDNIALLQFETYEQWWKETGKKTRNMVRKAKKSGLVNKIVEPNKNLVKGIWKIYNETPIRQGRRFVHYGVNLKTVERRIFSSENSVFIGAYLEDELVGFVQLILGEKIAIISQILSKLNHWDKAVNNNLIAKTIEFCSNKDINWIMYGRMGNHPSLDRFKNNNGFNKYNIPRYYIPLTKKGVIISKLRLQRSLKDILPHSIKTFLIPVYNWVNRKKTKIKQ